MAREIADLAIASQLSPLDLMRTPYPVLKALYDGLERRSKQQNRGTRHG